MFLTVSRVMCLEFIDNLTTCTRIEKFVRFNMALKQYLGNYVLKGKPQEK